MTPLAAKRLARESAVQPFAGAAKALKEDWSLETLDGKQVQRWSEALGETLVAQRDAEVQAYREGRRPEGPANGPQLLVVGMDGGRWQGLEKDEQTQSRWREEKVFTATTFLPGNGKEGEEEEKPKPLVTTVLATACAAVEFGKMARVEAERRGLRQALIVLGMGDGGTWIDPLFDREFRLEARIIDWCHANEHLWDCAKAIHGPQTPQTSSLAEYLEALLWDGRVAEVIAKLAELSNQLGAPLKEDGPQHPRRVLSQNVGYFTRHKEHMRYPEFRAKGWPIGSGITEAGVKQFNKRVKGTEQFWGEPGVEAILALRGHWVSQDDRWDRYWDNRPAYVK